MGSNIKRGIMDIYTNLHYHGDGHCLLASTRDECSSSYVQILSEVAQSLYPEFNFTIEYLPSKEGSFLDRIRVKAKKEFEKQPLIVTAEMAVATVSIVTLIFMAMSYRGNILNTETTRMATCIDLHTGIKEKIEQYNNQHPEEPLVIENSRLKAMCGDIIKKRKNKFYKGLIMDSTITQQDLELTRENKDAIRYTIGRKEFKYYLEDLQEDTTPSTYEIRKVRIESPVIVNSNKIWRASDWDTKENLNFYLEDHNFRNNFLLGLYPVKTSKKDDILIGLFEFKKKQDKDGKIKVTRKSVINVFQYQDHQIKPIPDNLKQYLPKEDSFIGGDDELFPKYNFRKIVKDKEDDN